MIKHKSLFLRISITLGFLLFLLVIVNWRVDFRPNSIIIDADFGDIFKDPVIHLNSEDEDHYIQIKSGAVRASLVDDISNLRIDFPRKELLSEDAFRLMDQSVENGVLTTTWKATLPEDSNQAEDIHTFLLLLKDQTATYRFFIDETEWLLTDIDGRLLAENPSSIQIDPSSITIIKKESVDNEVEQRDNLLGIESIIAISDDPGLIHLNSIRFVHSFGRLGINAPLLHLTAEEINDTFILVGCGNSGLLDNGSLTIYSGKTDVCSLEYTANLQMISQRINDKINQFLILVNIPVFVVSGIFFLGSPTLLKIFNRYWSGFRRKFSFTAVTTLIFFFLGVIFSIFVNNKTYQTILLLCSISFLISLILDVIFPQKNAVKYFDQRDPGLLKKETYFLISILIICIIALFFRLGSYDFYDDEFQVIEAAAGYLKTGQFARWDWIEEDVVSPYGRAWPHTFLIVQSFRVFGMSEWSARLPSVLFGIGFFISYYFFTRYFTNQQIALLSLLSAIFFRWYLRIFRFTRMYALLIPLSLLLAYFLYRWLTGECKPNTGIQKIDNLIEKYLNFDYKYLLISIPLLYLNYLIHVNSLIIVLALFVYVCLLAIIEKKKKYIILSVVGILVVPVVILVMQILTSSGMISYSYNFMPSFMHFFSAFGMRRFEYFTYLLYNPFGVVAGFSLFVFMAFILIFTKKDPNILRKYLYLFVITFTSAIFFIFVADRVAWYFYISHITPIALILIMSGFWYLNKIHIKKPVIMVIFLLLVLIHNFSKQVPDLYFANNDNGVYSEAYQVINDEYDSDNEVIFGQYLRTYYLQDIENGKTVSMQNDQTYSFEQFRADLEKYQQGWITWESKKSYHLTDEIIDFIDSNFEKIHGSTIDDTNVEVYYFSWPDVENIENQQ